MRKIYFLIIVSILSGCGFRSAVRLAFGDWSSQAALAQADRDYSIGRAKIYYGPIGHCGPGMNGPLGIANNERELVNKLPIEQLPCGSCGYYGSESEMKLCRKQIEYGAEYNKRLITLVKCSDNNHLSCSLK